MGIDDEAKDDTLQRQIMERVERLLPVAEEYFKLRMLLGEIDRRPRLPVPEYIRHLVGSDPPSALQRRREPQTEESG